MHKLISKMPLLATAWILAGCSSLHLYDKTSDQLASNAKTSYEDSKVVDGLNTVRFNLEALEKKEKDAFLKVNTVRRDIELLAILNDSNSKRPFVARFREAIDHRIDEILPRPRDKNDSAALDLDEVKNAQEHLKNMTNKEELYKKQLTEMGPYPKVLVRQKLPKCEIKNESLFKEVSIEALGKAINVSINPSEAVANSLLNAYRGYVNACRDLLSADQRLIAAEKKAYTGTLVEASSDVATRAKNLADSEDKRTNAKVALTNAIKNVANAQKSQEETAKIPSLICNVEKDGTETNPKNVAEPNDICTALANLKKLGDVGVKVISEEQITRINQVLIALSESSTSEDKTELPPALAFLSTSRRFAGAIDQYRSAKKLPALEPLLIERQLATSRLAYATQGYELQKRRLTLSFEKRDALLSELDDLFTAKAHLASIKTPTQGCKPKSDDAYCASASFLMEEKRLQVPTEGENPGRAAFRALVSFAESLSVGRARYESADLQLILSEYRDALNRSDAALASWDALIVTPLAQVAAYRKSGITGDEIAKFLQAFSLVAIAAGIW